MIEKNFRKRVLELINPLIQPIPIEPSIAFVWPTETCSIGCAHCSYNSKKDCQKSQFLLSEYPEDIVKWLADAGIKRFVVCGGGEPLDEPEFLSKAIYACAIQGLDFELYTSGISYSKPHSIEDYISTWKHQWAYKIYSNQRFYLRFSVDSFHQEIIGIEPLAKWIFMANEYAPEWNIAIRCLRLEDDNTIYRLAKLLNGFVEKENSNKGWLQLNDGKKISIIWKGFIFEGRGLPLQLNRLGLKIPQCDLDIINPYIDKWINNNELGRPLSMQLYNAVAYNRINLEIRSNCDVHILNSQAKDLRLNFFNYTWKDIAYKYYRDPLLHRIIECGLSGIADLILECQKQGIASKKIAPFSIEKIDDKKTLEWITAKAILTNSKNFIYGSEVTDISMDYLQSYK